MPALMFQGMLVLGARWDGSGWVWMGLPILPFKPDQRSFVMLISITSRNAGTFILLQDDKRDVRKHAIILDDHLTFRCQGWSTNSLGSLVKVMATKFQP